MIPRPSAILSALSRLSVCAPGNRALLATVASAVDMPDANLPPILQKVRPTSPAYFTGNYRYYDLLYELSNRLSKFDQYNETMKTVCNSVDLQEPDEQQDQVKRMRLLFKTKETLLLERNLLLSPIQHKRLVDHLTGLYLLDPHDELVQNFLKHESVARLNTKIQVPSDMGCAKAVGSRKTSRATVQLLRGDRGWFKVNNIDVSDYFKRSGAESAVFPLQAANAFGKYHVWATVSGGGANGQAEAVGHALAKALVIHEPHLQAPFDSAGLLKADTRQVERKKPGQKKARKKFTWVKR